MNYSTIGSIDWAMIIASVALTLSVINTYFSWRRRLLETDQERRRKLRLEVSLVHCFYKVDPDSDGRLYAFQLTVRNPSDTSNAISEADLAITYITKECNQMTARIRVNEPNTSCFVHGDIKIILIPTPILAHDTISGWLQFRVPVTILKETKIDSYRIMLRDTAGNLTHVDPILIQEYRDET